jgi:dipeptidyl aminopeptidase/acylaminoacyl peptidase
MSFPFERFLNIRRARCAGLRADGDRLAFLTDITGTDQLWVLDGPAQWPRQLTFYDDRLMFAEYHPTDPLIAFGKDRGGDEQQIIFAISDRGGLAERLSPTDAKHLWGGFSPDGDLAAWAHNGRNGRDFDLYVFDMQTRRERCIHEGEGYDYIAGWSHDGGAVIAGRAESNLDNDLWLQDVQTGDRTHMTPHDDDAIFSSPVAHPDGERIFLISNKGREFRDLAVWNRQDEELTYVDEEDWDREALALSDDGRWLASSTNEHGYGTLELRDLETGAARQVEAFKESLVADIDFQRDSHQLSLTVSGPADTTDAWTLKPEDGTTRRWTRSSTAGIPRRTLVQPELVHYESFDGLEIPAFYYVHPDTEPPFPVIISIHGGPESQYRPTLRPALQYFMQKGFAVLAPNVRGSTGYGRTYTALDDRQKRPDSVADIEAAYQWLVDEGRAHREQVGLIGGSYGGFMVLSAMTRYPDLWAAGVDIVGIANFVTFLENTSDYRRHLREAEYGSLDQDRELLESLSPIHDVDAISAPLMVVHGANDPRVPVSEARQVIEAVEANGVPVEALIYDDEGHGLSKRTNRLDAYPKIGAFFERHLLEGPTSP